MLGIATGNVRPAAMAKLTRGGLAARFACGGFGSDHRERAQLVARGVERARQLHARTAKTSSTSSAQDAPVVVVGDTPSDVAGVRALTVVLPRSTNQLERAIGRRLRCVHGSACVPDGHGRRVSRRVAWGAPVRSIGLPASARVALGLFRRRALELPAACPPKKRRLHAFSLPCPPVRVRPKGGRCVPTLQLRGWR